MQIPEQRLRYLIIWTLLWPFLLLNAVDPRFPQDLKEESAKDTSQMSPWLPTRIRQMEAERNQLMTLIDQLPQHRPKPLTSELGFHSLESSPVGEENSGFHYLTADLTWNQQLNTIGLVPSHDPLEPLTGTYAFPKRFKIQVLEGTSVLEDGQWVRGPDGTEWVDVVNWMDQDFPDPGPYPVVFSDINLMASKVRLAVAESGTNSGSNFFALSELYLFRGQNGEIADNMSDFGSTGIAFSASDTLSMKPYWDLSYVYDGVSMLGLPLSESTADVEDFIIRLDIRHSGRESPQIILDLGQVERIGRIELWPTKAPKDMAVPLFGFPGKVRVEISKHPDFRDGRTIETPDTRALMHNDNLLTIICDGENARYIRLTFDDLFEFMGQAILGLGEVSVLEFGDVYSNGCQVISRGIPNEFLDQLPRLVDGYSRQRRILPESDWIVGLAKRRPLDIRLQQVEKDLARAQEEWNGVLARSGGVVGILFLISIVFGFAYYRRQRQTELKKLKLQITRDLHDEVGSSLGSISLTSEQLENLELDDNIKEELGELSLMAREANASLLEVVWMTDQKTVRLPDLVKKLVERAQKVLRNQEVIADVSPECPDLKVNLTAKRHVISFFKEAVHNCARHAQATRVLISVIIRNQLFKVSIQDNGRGFDPNNIQDGWGLDSMKKRAKELGGNLEIITGPDEGTGITLEVPLANLSIDPIQSYKTSN